MRSILPLLAAAALAAADGDDGYEGHGRAGWGAWVVPAPLAVQAERDLAPGEGGIVLRVRPGGTADSLGVAVGDVVTTLNGQPVSNRRDIRHVVSGVAPGDEATVTVVGTDGAQRELTGEFQARPPRRPGPPPWAGVGNGAWGGGGFGPGGGWDGGVNAPLASPWWGDAQEAVGRQYRQLLAESADLRAAEADLVRARAALPPPTAWALHIDLACGDAPDLDLP